MKPARLILIRHAESVGNVDKAVYGHTPDYALGLSLRGEQQAEAAGRQLRALVGEESVFAYVSPLWRTRRTFEHLAGALAPNQVRWREEPRVREQEWGHLRDLAACAATNEARDAYGTFYYRIPEGESGADVYDRVSDFFGTLHRDFAKPDFPDNALIVTHGMTLRLFLMRWFHWTVEDFEQVANPGNCQLVILERQPDGKYRLATELRRHTVAHAYQRPLALSAPAQAARTEDSGAEASPLR